MSDDATRLSPSISEPSSDPARALDDVRSILGKATGDHVVGDFRGVCRLMRLRGLSPLLEVPLPDGRRADVIATAEDGRLWLIEVKSSPEDFWADLKWPDYLDWCDRFLFAVPPAFPIELIPPDVGLIVGDAFGAEILRDDPRPTSGTALTAARRKALLVRLGRLGAERLQRLVDPDFIGDM